jgi:hypothetical protein
MKMKKEILVLLASIMMLCVVVSVNAAVTGCMDDFGFTRYDPIRKDKVVVVDLDNTLVEPGWFI